MSLARSRSDFSFPCSVHRGSQHGDDNSHPHLIIHIHTSRPMKWGARLGGGNTGKGREHRVSCAVWTNVHTGEERKGEREGAAPGVQGIWADGLVPMWFGVQLRWARRACTRLRGGSGSACWAHSIAGERGRGGNRYSLAGACGHEMCKRGQMGLGGGNAG